MSNQMTPESDDNHGDKKTKQTPEQAKMRLATIKQGSMSVQKYFDACRKLCEIVTGEVNEHTDVTLLASFMNGLNDNIRDVLKLVNIGDAFTARRMAIQEEMFCSLASLRSKNGEEDRIHKMEMLHHMGWEKMRSFDHKFHFLTKELAGARKEIVELKETIVTLNKKEAERTEALLAELKKLNEPKEKSDNEVHEKLASIEKNVDISYEWIRTIHKDLEPRRAAEKRSVSSEPDEALQPTPKRAKHTPTEESVLDEMRQVLSQDQLAVLSEDNVTVGITKLYDEYATRTEDIGRWMSHRAKPVEKPCMLCGNNYHHAYECDKVRSVRSRKAILNSMKNYCAQCSNLHSSPCKAKLACPICVKARDEGRFLVGGVGHARIMCPLQEEYHYDMEIADKLFQAKLLLESV